MIWLDILKGQDWVNCERIGKVQVHAIPRAGELIEVRKGMDLEIADVIHAIRHVLDEGQHTVEALIFEQGASVYETRGLLTV